MKTLAKHGNWTLAGVLGALMALGGATQAVAGDAQVDAKGDAGVYAPIPEVVDLGDDIFGPRGNTDDFGIQEAPGGLDERFRSAVASAAALTIQERARAFDGRGGVLGAVARAMALDAGRIGNELADRLDVSALRRFSARAQQNPAGVLDRMEARIATEALTALTIAARGAWAQLSVHHPALADAYRGRIGQYLQVLAADVAAAIRAELEDEFGLGRPRDPEDAYRSPGAQHRPQQIRAELEDEFSLRRPQREPEGGAGGFGG